MLCVHLHGTILDSFQNQVHGRLEVEPAVTGQALPLLYFVNSAVRASLRCGSTQSSFRSFSSPKSRNHLSARNQSQEGSIDSVIQTIKRGLKSALRKWTPSADF